MDIGAPTTFAAGLRSTGLVAPLVLEGPMNGSAFLAYVQRFLAPTLRPGDVVVMDSLAAHKVAGVEDAIRATGVSLIYLLPYFARPQPDRAGVCQAQGPAPGRCSSNQ